MPIEDRGSVGPTRSAEQRLLNAVQRPQTYREVVLASGGAEVVLSVWTASVGLSAAFLPAR